MDNPQTTRTTPEKVKEAFLESDKYFPNPIQKFQFFDKYSRFNYNESRRETWVEAVDRSVNYLQEVSQNKLKPSDYKRIKEFVLNMKAAPSMRLLAMAGPAAQRSNIAIYNCSFMPVDSIDAWVEGLIISMNGCGVGFSVESENVNKLPEVVEQTGEKLDTFVIPDSTEGWASALRLGLETWFSGKDVEFDYSVIRPVGSILKIKGGRASGPEPLRLMLDFIRKRVIGRAGGKLRPLDAHDIMCQVGNAAVSGGTRRTAMISLFDFDDEEMRKCKYGDFEKKNSQRWNANNSAVWPNRKLSQQEIAQYMMDMAAGGNGEPGIFSRRSAQATRPYRRKSARFGTNPCGEIILRPYEFCNLSIAIARADDTLESLKEKVEVAAIIGTIQSMATNFPGLRPIWKKNCEEERLLGVDITGQQDCPVVQDENNMAELRNHAVNTNRKYAEILGVNQSVSVTCVKPSGNSSQLFNCSSGIHGRWAPYYIRNIRVGADSPLFGVLKDAGMPMDPENGQVAETAITWVAHFPVASPVGAVTRNDRSAVEQCEYWLKSKTFWTEHNPSVTINYKPNELIDLIKWVYDHQNVIGGMSFLPSSDARYTQMPYEEITPEQYVDAYQKMPNIDFSRVWLYEEEDQTKAAQELACVGDRCEI